MHFTHTWEESVLWLRENNIELSQLCYYDDPIEAAAERFYKSAEWLEVEKVLQKKIPGKILDVGSGRGISAYSFAKSGCEVFALEPDKSKTVGQGCINELNRRANLNIKIISDIKELESLNIQFDIIYCRAALHHIPNLESFFHDINKFLKKDGYFLATREHLIKNDTDKKVFLNNHALHRLYGGENAYRLDEYTQSIEKFDLKLVKIFHQYDSVINYFPMKEERGIYNKRH
jgi:2-polyprenyl-3-methyl-5-hydroxy-6-metoxy-1,4-benzoquinol methylase